MEKNELLKAWVHFLKDPESKIVDDYSEIFPEIKRAKDLLVKMSNDPKMIAMAKEREKSYYKITNLEVDEKNYFLFVEFSNEMKKIVSFREKLKEPFYAALKDETLFKQAKIDKGGYGVSWSDDIDISEVELWKMLSVHDFR